MNIVEVLDNWDIFKVREPTFPETESLKKDDRPFSLVIDGVAYRASGTAQRERLREKLKIANAARFKTLMDALEKLCAIELSGNEVFAKFGDTTTYSEDVDFPEDNTYTDLTAFIRSLHPQPGNDSGTGFRP